jgi:hypothetical protein
MRRDDGGTYRPVGPVIQEARSDARLHCPRSPGAAEPQRRHDGPRDRRPRRRRARRDCFPSAPNGLRPRLEPPEFHDPGGPVIIGPIWRSVYSSGADVEQIVMTTDRLPRSRGPVRAMWPCRHRTGRCPGRLVPPTEVVPDTESVYSQRNTRAAIAVNTTNISDNTATSVRWAVQRSPCQTPRSNDTA